MAAKTFDRILSEMKTEDKRRIIKSAAYLPSSKSIESEVEKSNHLQILYEYSSFENDVDEIKKSVENKSLRSRDILLDILDTLRSLNEYFTLDLLDYILVLRTQLPILCLENINDTPLPGVSFVLEINDYQNAIFCHEKSARSPKCNIQ